MRKTGRHFLQIPGPSNLPDQVLRAIDMPIIDHRGPDFAPLMERVLTGMQALCKCAGPVIVYPASGTGAWEAALVNTRSPGDHVLMYETGQFALQWKVLAERMGLEPEFLQGDWRTGASAAGIEARLRDDTAHTIKAVCVVHNETSTGCVTDIAAIRKAIDAAGHPALLMVDTISSLGCLDYRHDEWGVDVTVGASQKGLMMPTGISFNALSEKALAQSKTATMPKAYWSWEAMINANRGGYFPYTPATNLFYGLVAALDLIEEEGLDNVFARHARHAEATRRAVRAWGLEIVCRDPAAYSASITAVYMPEGHSADRFRRTIFDTFNMSLGAGLSRLADKAFRIGHVGDFNDLMLLGTLGGVEMGLEVAGVPHSKGGVQAAMDYLTAEAAGAHPLRDAAE